MSFCDITRFLLEYFFFCYNELKNWNSIRRSQPTRYVHVQLTQQQVNRDEKSAFTSTRVKCKIFRIPTANQCKTAGSKLKENGDPAKGSQARHIILKGKLVLHFQWNQQRIPNKYTRERKLKWESWLCCFCSCCGSLSLEILKSRYSTVAVEAVVGVLVLSRFANNKSGFKWNNLFSIRPFQREIQYIIIITTKYNVQEKTSQFLWQWWCL